jgi:hypothetical protein
VRSGDSDHAASDVARQLASLMARSRRDRASRRVLIGDFSDRPSGEAGGVHGQPGCGRVRLRVAAVRRRRRDEDVQKGGGNGRHGRRPAEGGARGQGHHGARGLPLLLQSTVPLRLGK